MAEVIAPVGGVRLLGLAQVEREAVDGNVGRDGRQGGGICAATMKQWCSEKEGVFQYRECGQRRG